MNENYYQILGLEPNCSKEEIKKAYKNYASKFHPDKHNGDPFFEEQFKKIKEAYDFLINNFERNKFNSNFNQRKYNYNQSRNSYSKSHNNNHKAQKEELEKIKKEKIKKKRKTLYYVDDKITINGGNLFVNNFSYKIADIDYILIKKATSTNSKTYAPILILLGIFTLTFIIGIFFLSAGIAGLFHKEYILIIYYKENHIPIIKGKKKYIEKIEMSLNSALKA
ncbi:DnaJ domain-containing protein [Tenacibaculum sp. 1B UA]|uniref:DnaJ domain-containing protein n=1 Tax=unclassified Tenacibaculum TaxID=2635139 RepID=UPI0026E3342D|nr:MULTISPECIES: DnaJ domain-containing protein [unclassified Tenacibaculum]MDO6676622.1 DnaJ domain-containing protein [Tenacibaculum sp. 1_MG-2023]MDX8555007.1 DnaJ domain-containing protein [Tenacibaculum sp. 1B UA]